MYFLKNKSEAYKYFQIFHVMLERQTGRKLKVVRSDRGREFSLVEFQKYCKSYGIHRECTAPYTARQNGVAEVWVVCLSS